MLHILALSVATNISINCQRDAGQIMSHSKNIPWRRTYSKAIYFVRSTESVVNILLIFRIFLWKTVPLPHTVAYRSGNTALPKIIPKCKIFLNIKCSSPVSRPALGPNSLPIQWVSEFNPRGVKRPESESDHSPPSSAEVKNAQSYTSTIPYVCTVWW
jgi:hypothetical protein